MTPPTNIDGTDITGATIDGTDVTEITVDGQTVFTAVNIPNSVASRTDDNDSVSSLSGQRGLEIEVNDTFDAIGARISNNTTGVDTARLLDSTNNILDSVNVSALTSGDAFTFSASLQSGQRYKITLDSSNYTAGFISSSGGDVYPFTSVDVDITGRVLTDLSVDTGGPHVVNDIGNVGF